MKNTNHWEKNSRKEGIDITSRLLFNYKSKSVSLHWRDLICFSSYLASPAVCQSDLLKNRPPAMGEMQQNLLETFALDQILTKQRNLELKMFCRSTGLNLQCLISRTEEELEENKGIQQPSRCVKLNWILGQKLAIKDIRREN